MCGGCVGGGREEVGGSDSGEWLLLILSCSMCWVICEILFIDLTSCGIRCHLWLRDTGRASVWSVLACGVEPWAPSSSKVRAVWLAVPQLPPCRRGSGGPKLGR